MLKKLASGTIHLLCFGMVMAIAAYWGVRVFTPAPTSAPPPLPPPPLRDPDPSAAARMFGKVEIQTTVATNVQALGAFIAGPDSSAVLVVDGRPPRVVLIGQEAAPGMKLVEVTADAVVMETPSGRQEVRLPARPIASFGGAPPQPNFMREGNTLTAPTSSNAPRPPAAPQTSVAPPPMPPAGPQNTPVAPPPTSPATQ
jgi:hypothetical protein